MSRKFQIKTVPSSWIEKQGCRLDCGPYMSGAMEAREILRQLPARKDYLQDLTEGGITGIINAGRITRLWVDDDQHGYPFLSSTDILQADLSTISHIAKSVARQNSQLLIKDRWTLITRSGSIGRMAYSRVDMNGMACTEDVLRVIPDENKVKPGYLYAYLGTKFGLPIVISGTYGSIITHLEPHHIADLPVPRLGGVEDQTHDLIQRAADDRVKATKLIQEAISNLSGHLGFEPIQQRRPERPSVSFQSSKLMLKRMDSFYYSSENIAARSAFDSACASHGGRELGSVADVWIPGIFKRQYADDPSFGTPYFTGKEIYELSPTTDLNLKKTVAEKYRLLLQTGMILIQDSGQVSGLIGRPALVGRNLHGASCTNNMVRIIAPTDLDTGFIFALLSTDHGVRLLKREASGSSIPHLEEGRMRRLVIPWPDGTVRNAIGQKVLEAISLRDDAVVAENDAQALVERTIEEGGR